MLTLNGFYSLAEVKRLMVIQGRAEHGSPTHRNAFKETIRLAAIAKLDDHFFTLEDYDNHTKRIRIRANTAA